MAAPIKDWEELTAKLERAEKHIFDLQAAWSSLIESDAYPIASHDTPDQSHRMYVLQSAPPIPVPVRSTTGDAIQNLASALDHLAYRLVCVGTDSDGPFDRVYFPVGDSPKEFKSRLKAIKKLLKPDAIKALAQIKAHPGGYGKMLWQIHKLNNIDKHRLLLAVSSQNRFHSMSPAEIGRIRYQFLGVLKDIPEVNDPQMFLKSGKRHLSLKAGHVLDVLPIAEVHENMHFPIEIAFGEAESLKGKPVLETLHQTASLIRNIFMQFDNSGLLG